MSEDSEYAPSDNETSSESDKTSNKSEDSDVSEDNNTRTRIKQKVSKPLSKHDIQSTPKKMGRGRNTVTYRDYVS